MMLVFWGLKILPSTFLRNMEDLFLENGGGGVGGRFVIQCNQILKHGKHDILWGFHVRLCFFLGGGG